MANGKKTLDIQDFIKQIKEDNCYYIKMTDKREPYFGTVTFCFTHGVIAHVEVKEIIK